MLLWNCVFIYISLFFDSRLFLRRQTARLPFIFCDVKTSSTIWEKRDFIPPTCRLSTAPRKKICHIIISHSNVIIKKAKQTRNLICIKVLFLWLFRASRFVFFGGVIVVAMFFSLSKLHHMHRCNRIYHEKKSVQERFMGLCFSKLETSSLVLHSKKRILSWPLLSSHSMLF